jgi:hypothetical protein
MPNIVKPSGINQLWAAGGTKVAPSAAKTNIGWVVELPPYQYQNWLDNRQDTFIAHINQHGIPEWDTETEYQGNLSYTQGADGFIYKCLVTNTNFDPINPLNSTYWVRAFETYGSVAVVQNALTVHLNNYATLAGIANTVAARNNLSVWSKAESDARFAFKGGTSGQVFSVGTATAPAHAVPLSQLTSLLVNATESVAGQILLATLGEVETGTNDTKAITPLKASTVYLKKSGNLAGLTNLVTARANLGLADMAEISSVSVMFRYDNLAGLTNVPLARSNLGLGTIATAPAGAYLQVAANLADLSNVAGARSNLGLTTTATTPLGNILLKADNLAGIGNQAIARQNLGLSDSGVYPSNTWLIRTSNLADLTNVQTARNNLGLADSATIASANFLYAANNLSELPNKPQARINLGLTAVSYADPNIFMYKGENLIGLTNLAAARANLGLGNLATANAYGILGPDITFQNNWDAAGGATVLPNFVKMQWGSVSAGGSVTFRYPFTQSYSVVVTHGPNALGAPGAGVTGKTLTGFTLGYGTGGYMWQAIGV